MKPTLDLWFEFASTYSYLTVMRIGPVAEVAGLSLKWRPFLLGPIFNEQGWNDSPFNIYPKKGAYMWRDLERLCEGYGLYFKRPSKFPRNGLLAARAALVAGEGRWCPEFTRAVYRANFAEDREISDPAVLTEIISDLGQDPSATLEAANTETNKGRLKTQTEAARTAGIFGSPSFASDGELFWGNDRMGDAIAWALGAR